MKPEEFWCCCKSILASTKRTQFCRQFVATFLTLLQVVMGCYRNGGFSGTSDVTAAVAAKCAAGKWLRGRDLNSRPSGYEPDELPGCSTPRSRGGLIMHQLFCGASANIKFSPAPTGLFETVSNLKLAALTPNSILIGCASFMYRLEPAVTTSGSAPDFFKSSAKHVRAWALVIAA